MYGYKTALPEYRTMTGTPKAWNPYHGWVAVGAPASLYEVMSSAATGQSIAALEELLARDGGGNLHMPMPRKIVDHFSKQNYGISEMSVVVGRSNIVAIIDTVRNMVLEWAISLEKSGIKGENMSFNDKERQIAQATPSISIGSIGTFTGVVGSGNTMHDIVANISTSKVLELATQLESNLPALISAGADGAQLSGATSSMLLEAAKPNPDGSKLRALLGDARSALAGATGNLVAEGALALIASLLS
jgi:hypothetical protein